ncbi:MULTISPECIES: SusC/RagA family TonB-linked outer membrane protein [unclassified Dysgonomonas]|uniref:SusC/RagA family TonB-linked outer membrane protein n=1 Tax=unclassified Dysgonomonas TaxID=2630389 RepID=UPI0025C70598|nr:MULTISPECIES: SusC/RagA family TonB-linked outer membrane protein [unclassified Dysgonomonas]HMM03732.1 SusC/RagA family TonB-linked outer membrane protein [Dysgonomonas sp.]
MKKRLLLILSCLFLSIGYIAAQTTKITGTVVDDLGEPAIGVSVVVKGTTIGTVTDVDGTFSINLPEGKSTLVFSFIGMKTKEEAAKEGMKVVLEQNAQIMNEVVVTAMGITKEKKALGYAVADLGGDELIKSRGGVSNPINALVGKVAGLQITGSSGNMGGSSKVLLRGVKSLTGNNQPLFVVDGVPIAGQDFNSTDTQRGAGGYDYGNLIQDLNPDDIENISVLKGPNASALYGSRASNGVIMITTKKGEINKGLGISVNSAVGFEVVSKLPKMQKEYGGGSALTRQTINGKEFLILDYDFDESWGPKYDPSTQYLSWYDIAKWEAGGKVGDPTTSAWVAPEHDIEDFFETGVSFTNNISLSQATDKSSIRVSYTNMTLNGYMPNSSLQKNSFNIAGSITGNKIYELFTNVTYLNQAAKGRSETGYGDNNVMQKFIQWGQRQLDMKQLKEMYMYPDGKQAGWNRSAWDDPTMTYSNNPYWSRYKNYQNDSRDRLYGNVGIKFTILPQLKAQYKLNLDYYSDKQYTRNAVYSQEQSKYVEMARQQHELNHEFMVMYNGHFNEDFTLDINAGGNIMYNRYEYVQGESVGGLVLPDFYNLSNSVSQAKAINRLQKKSINSLFANATFGYKGFAYLDATLRNDWSSTLPKGNNSYLYPSVTGSFLFSELLDLSWLDLGKIRLGWAKVGNDTDPYNIYDTYTFYASFNDNPAYITSVGKKNPNLKPESTYSTEIGIEGVLFGNRLSFDMTYYKSRTEDNIIPLSLSGATGYTSYILNAATIENKGAEIRITGIPVQTKDFEWEITGTFSANKNKVTELLGDTENGYLRLTNAPFKVEVGARVGEEYGVIMGTDYVYDSNGNKIVNANGTYKATDGNVPLGSAYPKTLWGITNSFRYKDLTLSVLFDAQFGGKYFSTSNMWGIYSGMLEETAGSNELGNPKRDPVANGGGILLSGVNEDGTPNTTRISATRWASSIYSGPAAQNVFKSDYIKLREITIGYNIPLRSTKYIKNLKVSAYGRNLAMFGLDNKSFDPEMATTSSGNIQGVEGGALPSTANFGLNVGFQF